MTVTRTHNAYHLGDNLVHLNFLRKVALANPDRQFVHAAQWQYRWQLQPLVDGISNLSLADFSYLTPSDSIDAWRGARGFWYSHPIRNDFAAFHVEWFNHLAERMDVQNPIQSPESMLFDYPAIRQSLNGKLPVLFDVLVINSPPGSNQFRGYEEYGLANLAERVARNGYEVITTAQHCLGCYCTADFNLSVTQIGYLSLHCHTIVMVSTGPSWPTFNVWNLGSIKLRVILLDSERVNLAPNSMHCASVDEAAELLKGSGIL